MIAVLGVSACIDRTIRLERLLPGGTNRALSWTDAPGGKGVNVTRALRQLGEPVRLITLGWAQGMEPILCALEASGAACTTVPVPGALRVNTKLLDTAAGQVTEVNLSAVLTRAEAADELIEAAAQHAQACQWLVLTGSLPQGVEADFYARAIRAICQRAPRCRIALDASDEALRLGVAAKPDCIKPNRHELSALVGQPMDTPRDALAAARALVRQGIGQVIVSLDAAGAMLVTAQGAYWADALSLPIATTVGAGDALLAGFLHAACTDSASDADRLALGMASAAARVSGREGEIARYLPAIQVVRMGE